MNNTKPSNTQTNPASQDTTAALPNPNAASSSSEVASHRSPHKFDWYWLLIGGVAATALVAALIINFSYTDTDTDTASEVANTITTDNGDLKINWDRYPTYDVELTGTYSITQSGTYHLTGSISDGSTIIKANDGVVRLILDNVTIKNSTGPAIACYSADDLVIELAGENTLADGATYSSDYDTDVTGAIYSKADLTFQGSGTLDLTANYQDAIVSKDDLKFNSGTYNITAIDEGIRGKDSVYIVDGSYTIASGGSAIASTNETDKGKGFVMIENGDFTLTAGAKGIKAVNSIVIYDGTFAINSTDDAVHSNNYIGIISGNLSLSSSDDGIHADRELIIDGGNITVAQSYEGLEAQAITINGGEISVTASDDGLNAGGGTDSSSQNRPGANPFNSDEACILTIAGGNIYVNASGDGIDSNGYVYFNGGTVVVDGPTNNGNGALDSGISIEMNGGTVIAVGASGMAETLGQNSNVYNASIYFSTTQAAGTTVEIKNSAGATIISHTSAKTFNHMAVGTEQFTPGETYTVYVDGTNYTTFTISGVTTTVGNSNTNQYNMPGGGPQRR